jgi:hypothetical protein
MKYNMSSISDLSNDILEKLIININYREGKTNLLNNILGGTIYKLLISGYELQNTEPTRFRDSLSNY